MAGRSHRRTVERNHAPAPELSRKVSLHEVDERPVRLQIETSPEEREGVRRRFDLEGLHAFRAAALLDRLDHGGVYRLEGTLRAEVTQLCVVTLEPIESVVEGPFSTTFVRADDVLETEPAEVAGDVDEDEPEPFSGDFIDAGEAVVQELASMLDLYPRLPEAAVEPSLSGEEEAAAPSPFAVLEKLRNPRGSDAE